MAQTIGEKIKALRKSQKLTLNELSSKVDISVSFLSDIENNRNNPSLDRLKDLAKGLGVLVSELLSEEPIQPTKKEKDINKIMASMETHLSSMDGLMLNGEPASEEAIQSILDALRVGVEIAKERNKKYTPKKYKKDNI